MGVLAELRAELLDDVAHHFGAARFAPAPHLAQQGVLTSVACDLSDANSSHFSRVRAPTAMRRRREDGGGDRAHCHDERGDRTASGIARQ